MCIDPPLYYAHHVFVCTNHRPDGHRRGSCAGKGAEPLRDYLKAKVKELGLDGVRVNSAGCLDRCELGPTLVIYPEGIWYAYRTTDDLDEIIEVHLRRGGRVDRLMLRPEHGPRQPCGAGA